jgi:outer membrane protein TolC
LRKVEVLSALANLLPTLSVTGGGAYTSNSTTVPHRYLTGGVGGVLTLFDGLQTIAETMKAQEAKSAAFKLREDAANTLMVSVWQAWVNLRQARDRQAVAAANRFAAEVDYEETTARYQQGQETLSEVLDAYSVCEQARIDALSASYAEALAEVVFRDTVGLGWGDAVVASAPQAE